MASRKAKQFLRDNGIDIVSRANKVERGNFRAGRGIGRYSLRYQVIRMDDRCGDSKATMGWTDDLSEARAMVDSLRAQSDGIDSARGGAEHMRNRHFQYYIRDIRDNRSIR